MPEMPNGAACRRGPGGLVAGDGLPHPKRKAQPAALCQSFLVQCGWTVAGAGCGLKPKNRRAAMHFGLFSGAADWLCSACLYGRDLVDGALHKISRVEPWRTVLTQ